MRRMLRSISVDVPLQRRMQKRPEVNWSKVAREAFEAELDRVEHVKAEALLEEYGDLVLL